MTNPVLQIEDVLWHKFIQHVELRNMLLNTGYSEILFRDPMDLFWGMSPEDHGENFLGKALMNVRERLRQEAAGR